MGKEQILNFWEEQAKRYDDSPLATMPDLISFGMEMERILKELEDGQKVLNIGCGNGVKDIEYCREKQLSLKGIDFSSNMIEVAKKQLSKCDTLKGTLEFEQGDILKLDKSCKYDVVITNRCLINLESDEEHIIAINNIYDILKDGGMFLMMECTKQGLNSINEVRKTFELEEIKERWHNCYLDEDVIIPHLLNKFEEINVDNFNSTYFLISRTLNALLTKEGEQIDYMADINKYAAKLPATGSYAPLKLFKLIK